MRLLYISALLLAAPSVAIGNVVPIGPFTGDYSEPLNQPFTLIAASIDIFDGAASLNSHDYETTLIHLIISSTFGGVQVTPHTGSRILGFTQGPGIFDFEEPARRFGAYWNNNSGTANAIVEFFDVGGNLVDTQQAVVPLGVWTWNGWESDVPISSIRVTGFGVLDGFLWFDDLEMSVFPAPGGLALFALGLMMGGRRRRVQPARDKEQLSAC